MDSTADASESSPNLQAIFEKKYSEFAADLLGTFPELEAEIRAAQLIPADQRAKQYMEHVMTKHTSAAGFKNPGPVLPGVTIPDSLWSSVTEATKKAVYDYLSILDLCNMFDTEDGTPNKDWAEKIMRDWRGRLDRVDFDSLSKKFMDMFGEGGKNLPPLPEKFLKGKLAKLAEEMVREFKPEDFGLSPDDIAACEKDPTRAFEILMQASASNMGMLQTAMTRIGKKLQAKVARGELRPQDLAAEAQELIEEFKSHPAFVEMMESFRSAFSFEDPDLARSAGRDNDSRLSIARARLRKKLDAKKQKK